MKFVSISFLALASTYVAAQDIDNNDVPSQCSAVCASVVSLTTTCDAQNDDDDSGYINCVCSGSNAATEIPACEACVANYDTNDGHDNDVNDLIRSCSFTTTAFVSATATDQTTLTGTASTTDSNASGFTIQTSTPTSGVTLTTSQTMTTTSSASVTPATSGNPTSSASTSTSSGLGNVNGAPGQMGVVAAVFLGAFGML